MSLLPRGYIDGFVLVNDAGFTDNIDFSAGMCADSTNAVSIQLTATLVKSATAAWAAGAGSGLFTGSSVPSSTVLHCFVIMKTNGTVDAGFDTSVTAANRPAAYTYFRRVGSVITDTQPHIRLFHQYGDEFWWDTSILDVNASAPGTAAVTRTLTVPTGVAVKAILDLTVYDSAGTSCEAYVSNIDSADLTPLFTADIQSTASSTAAIEGYGAQMIWTNTSGQIRSRQTTSAATSTVRIRTRGWIDQRGRNS